MEKMINPFQIQLGHPKILAPENKAFDRLAEVFPKLFAENEESAYLFWHQIPIRWHYTYEWYANVDDIIAILWLIYSKQEGANKVKFMTDTLFIDWEVRWNDTDIIIKSTFLERRQSSKLYAEALNKHQQLEISKNDFIAEWNTLILQIIKCFTSAKIKITDEREIIKFQMLEKIAANFHQYGTLYIKS
jgi:hypothetical protein